MKDQSRIQIVEKDSKQKFELPLDSEDESQHKPKEKEDEIIDNYYLYSIDGRFISEAYYGQTIVSLTKNDINETNDKSFIHTIKVEETEKVCATAKTIWRKIKTRKHNKVLW